MKKQSAKYSKTEPSARRSNKSPTSPSGNPKPEDMLTQSQVNQELLKTQQSFRSSTGHQGQTPSISSKVTQSVTSPGRNMQKRPSQIISKQQMQNMHERSVIKVLGMSMEAVCPKKNHEKNKMLYICQYGDCKADNRLGCSYCLVESHNDHSQQVMEVQTFCKIFDDRKKQVQSLILKNKQFDFLNQQFKSFPKLDNQSFSSTFLLYKLYIPSRKVCSERGIFTKNDVLVQKSERHNLASIVLIIMIILNIFNFL